MVLTIMLVAGYDARVIDIKGLFLKGEFENNEEIYRMVPKGFKQFYPNINAWLYIMKPIHGLKQAGLYYYRKAKSAMQANGFEQSNADPCLIFKWIPEGIVMWITWVGDNLVIVPPSIVEAEKDMMKCHLECDDIGVLSEYVGCKINQNQDKKSVMITQPVLVQSLEDKFKVLKGTPPQTSTKPGTIS